MSILGSNNLRLNDLRDKPRATKKYKRVGRGKSNSPGHGGKGQTARTGVALGNFQGGQTPIERRLPKQRTFYTPDKMATVSLATIDKLFANKRIDADVITYDVLRKLKVVKKVSKYKLVGTCKHKFQIQAHAASKGAIESIEASKGKLDFIK
jgi:large subunit ribosomal protein L15